MFSSFATVLSSWDWEEMGNTERGQAKASTNDDAQKAHGASNLAEGLGHIMYVPGLRTLKTKAPCCRTCLKVLLVVLAIIIILEAIAVIAITISTAIATKIYSSEISGRTVAMILLAVTAAVAISMAIYAIISVFKKRNRQALHAASVVLIILVIIQAVITGVSVNVSQETEVALSRSLSESFRLAKEDNPRHVKIWATTQSDLGCCGVYSSEDYRTNSLPLYFPPDVPISCCPGYDPDRSELVQEREREICKAKKEFYDVSCRTLVLEVFKDTATLVIGVTVTLIVLEVLLAILSALLCSKRCSPAEEEENNNIEDLQKSKP